MGFACGSRMGAGFEAGMGLMPGVELMFGGGVGVALLRLC